MRSEVRCANCGKTEWTDSGKVMFIPREGVDFGGRWIHGADCGGDEVPVDELLQLQKEADWKRALNEYRQVREEIGRLEETGECACNVNEFHTCSLCAETTSLDQRARTLMNLWGDTWAMRLITAITFDIGVKSISQGPAREETIKAIQEDYENGAFGAFTSFDAVRTALATAYDAGARSRTPTNLESRTVAPQLEVSQWIDTELWNFVHGLALDLGVSLDAAGDKAKEEMIHRSMASVIVICSKLAGAAALPATKAVNNDVALAHSSYIAGCLAANTTTLAPRDSAVEAGRVKLSGVQDHADKAQIVGGEALPATPTEIDEEKEILRIKVEVAHKALAELLKQQVSVTPLTTIIASLVGGGEAACDKYQWCMRPKGHDGPCDDECARAASVPAASSPTTGELRRELDEVKSKLQGFITVTDYARCAEDSGSGDLQAYIEGLWGERIKSAAASSPEPNQGWIAVEERLPKPDEDNPSHSIEVQFWNDRLKRVDQGMLWFVAHKEGYWEGRCYAERDEVTYWRELPAPPVAQKDQK